MLEVRVMPRAGSGSSRSWPLVGRERELAAVDKAYAHPAGGVLLVGEPGVGRTRLAYEAPAHCLSSQASATTRVGAG